MPKTIYVGPDDYEVCIKKPSEMDRDRLLGETDTSNTEIAINGKQSRSSTQNTILHETLHAIFWSSGLNRATEMDIEEKVILTITPWVIQVLRDNPRLVAYLLEK